MFYITCIQLIPGVTAKRKADETVPCFGLQPAGKRKHNTLIPYQQKIWNPK